MIAEPGYYVAAEGDSGRDAVCPTQVSNWVHDGATPFGSLNVACFVNDKCGCETYTVSGASAYYDSLNGDWTLVPVEDFIDIDSNVLGSTVYRRTDGKLMYRRFGTWFIGDGYDAYECFAYTDTNCGATVGAYPHRDSHRRRSPRSRSAFLASPRRPSPRRPSPPCSSPPRSSHQRSTSLGDGRWSNCGEGTWTCAQGPTPPPSLSPDPPPSAIPLSPSPLPDPPTPGAPGIACSNPCGRPGLTCGEIGANVPCGITAALGCFCEG